MKDSTYNASRISRWALALALALSLALTLPPRAARAATIIVNTATDESDGSCSDGDCSLRDAIALAANGDIITFAGSYTIYLDSQLELTKTLTIDGSGHTVTLSGDSGGDGTPDVSVFSIGSSGVVTLTHLSIVSGTANWGGSIYNAGELTVQNSTLSGNSASWGGSIRNDGTLTVQNSTLSGNSAITYGGGIYNTGILTVMNSTFSGNVVEYYGGGICNNGTLTVQNSTFSGNSADTQGGGIFNFNALTVQNSTFTGNSARLDGGGIYNDHTLTVQNSTFTSNSVSRDGGGIYNDYALTVQNSTFTGNSAALNGGGIFSENTMYLRNSTLSGNSALLGGGIAQASYTLYLFNTLIANNDNGGDCHSILATISADHSLVEDPCSCYLVNGENGNIIGVDPLLSSLGDYGGPSDGSGQAIQTLAPLPGSPALNAGNDATCLPTDQRGVARPQGGACDMGAFESQGFTLTVSRGDAQIAAIHTLFPQPLGLTVTASLSEPVAGGWVVLTGPDSGAGTTFPVYSVLIGGGGAATQTVQANGVVGSYTVSADTQGNLGSAVAFSLTNRLPHIAVLGNGVVIADGDVAPSLHDHTDFGGVTPDFAITRTFTISNSSGVDSMTVYSLTLSGADAGDFTLAGLATPVTLPPHGAATFQVRFVPPIIATRMATVTISHNDGPENDFDFAIQGAGVCANHLSVTHAADDGAGSLRRAVALACNGGTIDFTGSYTLYLNSQLDVNKTLTIDGSGHTVALSGDSGGDGTPDVRVLSIGSSGVVTLTHLIVASGKANDNGGGIYNEGVLTLQDSALADNSAGHYGGGIFNWGTLYLQNSAFAGNSAGLAGGGIFNWGGTLYLQNGALTGNTAIHGGGIFNGGTLYLQNSMLTGNSAVYDGGGIYNQGVLLTVVNSTLSGNSARQGGGIFTLGDSVTLQDSTLSGNSASEHGGGVAILGGSLTLQNSTLSGNSASQFGGGILNSGMLYLQNSTLSGNSASQFGGGIFSENWIYLLNSTLSGNSAPSGGGLYNGGGELHLSNTLIANSPTGGDCFADGGSVVTNDHNLMQSTLVTQTCGLVNGEDGSLIGVDPLLGPLADNGGSTQTFALLPGSPAIDAGNDAACLPTDQRGLSRPQGVQCDIGAFEKEQPTLWLAKWVTPAVDAPYHGAVAYTLVLSNTGAISDTAVILTDTLPAGVVFGEWLANPGALAAGNAITWTGALTAETALTFTFTALHTGDYEDVITNTASFSGTLQTGYATATFSVVPTHTLTIGLDGRGLGAVSSEPGGIVCGELCAADYGSGTVITLTAAPSVTSTFSGWSGAVVSGSNPIAITLDADKTVTATFALKSYTITPTAGVGGAITPSAPQSVTYGGDLAFAIAPENGYHIADVAVDGMSVGAQSVYTFTHVAADHTLSATFALNEYALAVGVLGQGSVTRAPSQTTYLHGDVVTLTAIPEESWYFGGWSGDLDTANAVEHLTLDGHKTVTATFVLEPPVTHTLTIATAGDGSGVVTPTVGAHVTISGTLVTLGATPNPGSVFAGWSGDPGCADGQVTLDVDKTCTATFDLIPATYTLTFGVVGQGAVALDPPGGVYEAGTQVTLTATADSGWYFGGWSGDLNTASAVEHLTLDGNKAVTATFTQEPPVTHTLTIAIAGDGSGVVTPTVGAHVYVSGTLVTLGATPNADSVFAGWSGDPGCASGQVTLDADKVCTATFNLEESQYFVYLPLIAKQLP